MPYDPKSKNHEEPLVERDYEVNNTPCEYLLPAEELPDDLEPQVCSRNVWELSQHARCIWHTKEKEKFNIDFEEIYNIEGERIDAGHLRNSKLRDNISFENCHLFRADFSDADLQEANLQNADLREGKFIDTNLSGANLRDADLRGADLRKATLTNTTLDDADLTGTKFRCSWTVGTTFNNTKGSRIKISYLKTREQLLAWFSIIRSLISYMQGERRVTNAFYIILVISGLEVVFRSIFSFLEMNEIDYFQQVEWALIPLATELSFALTAFLITGIAIIATAGRQFDNNNFVFAFRDGVYFAISASVLGILIQSFRPYLTFNDVGCRTLGECSSLVSFMLIFYLFLFVFVGMLLSTKDIVELIVDATI